MAGIHAGAKYALAVNRDEQILQAALQLFVAKGFHGVGVDEIGDVAGVSGPAIYRHFAGKQDLLAAIFDQAMDRLLEFTGGGRSGDPWREIDHLIRTHTEFVLHSPDLAIVYEREDRSLEEPHRRRIRRRQRPYFERWVDCLSRAYPQVPADRVTAVGWAVLRLLNSQPTWPRSARATSDSVELMTDLAYGCIHAIAGRPSLTGSPSSDRVESSPA